MAARRRSELSGGRAVAAGQAAAERTGDERAAGQRQATGRRRRWAAAGGGSAASGEGRKRLARRRPNAWRAARRPSAVPRAGAAYPMCHERGVCCAEEPMHPYRTSPLTSGSSISNSCRICSSVMQARAAWTSK